MTRLNDFPCHVSLGMVNVCVGFADVNMEGCPLCVKLDCCWVGSLDFNLLGNQGVFH